VLLLLLLPQACSVSPRYTMLLLPLLLLSLLLVQHSAAYSYPIKLPAPSNGPTSLLTSGCNCLAFFL
jgi:hypothetical protein